MTKVNWIKVKDKPIPKMKTVLMCNEYQIACGYILHGDDSGLPSKYFSDYAWTSPITHWAELSFFPQEITE